VIALTVALAAWTSARTLLLDDDRADCASAPTSEARVVMGSTGVVTDDKSSISASCRRSFHDWFEYLDSLGCAFRGGVSIKWRREVEWLALELERTRRTGTTTLEGNMRSRRAE
jgi:hypothetical protein